MAKNELLPFADGEDANVLPTNQWEALTDILENGFQSGIARSEQVNRVLAQGAVASYVLGQLIVDQLNKDATLNKDTLYQNLVSALQETAKDVCLPLGGGNVTGKVNTWAGVYFNDANNYYTSFQKINSNGFFIENRTPDSALRSRICFRDDTHANAGRIEIDATNSTNKSSLILNPNGTATWAGKPIATGATASKANNGYFRDSTTGLTIQWGVNSLTHQTATTVTFPKAFTAVYSVVVQSALTSGWNSDNNGVAVTAKTTTNFTARTQAATSNYYWIAIGYCAS